MGEISPALLEMLRIPHRILAAKTIADDVAWGRAESERLSQPVALLLPPGVLDTASHAAASPGPGGAPVAPPTGQAHPFPTPPLPPSEPLPPPVAPLPPDRGVHP